MGNNYARAVCSQHVATTSLNTTEGESDGLRQVTIEMYHPGCWGLELSKQFPGSHFIEKSTYQAEDHIKADLVVIADDATEMDDILERAMVHENVYNLTMLKHAGDRARILAKYNKAKSVIPTITRSNLMAVEPFHITNGYKYWTVVAQSGTLADQIDSLEEKYQVQIKSIHDFEDPQRVEYADVVDQLYSALSPRQRETMYTAVQEGYYQWPREISADEIADSMGISGPTFLEHLRTGEKKLINKLFETFEQRNANHLLEIQ